MHLLINDGCGVNEEEDIEVKFEEEDKIQNKNSWNVFEFCTTCT